MIRCKRKWCLIFEACGIRLRRTGAVGRCLELKFRHGQGREESRVPDGKEVGNARNSLFDDHNRDAFGFRCVRDEKAVTKSRVRN